MGWILIHDRNNAFAPELRSALQAISQRIIGSNTLVQGALPDILTNTPQSFFDDTIAMVQENAEIAFERLQLCAGLHPVQPRGAMYMMVGIEMERFPEFATEFQFVERLVSEQSVFCLPGKCFEYPDYFRIVLTVPKDQLLIALDRIMEYCNDHYIENKVTSQSIVQVGGEQVQIDHPISNFRQSGQLTQ
jgi:tyrosine aminotransferase